MDRLHYSDVAKALADASDDPSRVAAAELLRIYYAVHPPVETPKQRIATLREALRSANRRDP